MLSGYHTCGIIIRRIIIGHYLRRIDGEEDLDVARECDFVRPCSRKRRGISRWGIDQCWWAPRVEHGDTRRFLDGSKLAERRQ